MRVSSLTTAVFFGILPSSCIAFVAGQRAAKRPRDGAAQYAPLPSTQLQLIPLTRYNQDISFLTESEEFRCCFDEEGRFQDGDDIYELCVVEEQDLPDLSRFVVSAFGADAISLSQDMNSIERFIMSPAAELLNGYSGLVAFAEVLSGTNQRLEGRLKRMDVAPPKLEGLTKKEVIAVAEKESLILAVGRRQTTGDWRVDIIASIELRLQPCDAKIPFSLPWLDRIERNLASRIGLGSDTGKELQPYLSNLCVDEKYRGRRIGKGLVHCLENITKDTWGYKRLYLHVDEDNLPAINLYKKEGYKDVGHRWNPLWAGSAAEIGYYVKTL